MSIPTPYAKTPALTLLAVGAVLACGPERSPVEPEVVPETAPEVGSAAIALSETEISFDLVEGDAAPPAGEIAISNSGERSLSGLAATAEYDGSATGWLELELQSTSAPSVLRVGLRADELDAGEYRATVVVTAAGVPNSPQSVGVTARVTRRPDPASIVLSTRSVELQMEEAGTNPDTARIDVTNGGELPLGSLTLDVIYDEPGADPWLVAALDPTEAPSVLKLAVLGSSLGLGTWGADVVVAAAEDADTVRVELTVTPAPGLLRMDVEAYTFTTAAGAPNPPVEEIDILNDAPGALVGISATALYSEGEPADWLSVAAYDNERGRWLSLGLLAGGLPEGTWTARVAVDADNATNGPVEVQVTAEVGPPSGFLNVSTGNIYLEVEYGAGNPAPLQFDVTNLSVGALEDVSVEVVPRAGSEGDWVSASVAATTTPTVLTVSFDADGLPARAYYADLAIRSDGASNSPVERRITFVITGGEPDLTVLGVPMDTAVVAAGESVDLPVLTFANIGSAPSVDFRVGFYLFTDPELTSAEVSFGAAGYSWLYGGEQVAQPFGASFEIPEGTTPGLYYLAAVVDDDDTTPESDETNNTFVRVVLVTGG